MHSCKGPAELFSTPYLAMTTWP